MNARLTATHDDYSKAGTARPLREAATQLQSAASALQHGRLATANSHLRTARALLEPIWQHLEIPRLL